MGKTIALTGAAGYLGTVLIDYLRAQPWVDRIIALDMKPTPADGRVISYLCDVRDGDFLRALFTEHAVSHVIHAAFIITPPRNMSPTEMHNANVEGSQAVIRAAFESHTRQLVFISSCSVYGYHAGSNLGVREDYPQKPTMMYAHHKVAVEQIINTEHINYPKTQTAIIRPVGIAGPIGRKLSSLRALTAQPLFILSGGGHAHTQAIHEADLAALIGRVVERDISGTFNAAPSDHATWAEIGKLSGLPTLSLPRKALNFATRFSTLIPALNGFSRDVVDLFSESLVCDNSAARHQIGWTPRYTTREAFAQLFGASIKAPELSEV